MMRSRSTAIIGSAALVAIGLIIGAGLAEVAYRGWLYRGLQNLFGVYDKSLWEFDQRFGYVYPPGRTVHLTVLNGGKVVSCRQLPPINAEGNVGDIKGDYASADLKVAVFGDSFTATQDNGVTWPNILQDRLTERLHRKVNVVNFGRDGYSLLQMFDLAAAKVPEWKPDLVMIAFVTDDLDRARFWRTAIEADGEERVLTTIDPTPHPAPDRASGHLHSRPERDSRLVQPHVEERRARSGRRGDRRSLPARPSKHGGPPAESRDLESCLSLRPDTLWRSVPFVPQALYRKPKSTHRI